MKNSSRNSTIRTQYIVLLHHDGIYLNPNLVTQKRPWINRIQFYIKSRYDYLTYLNVILKDHELTVYRSD